MSYTSTTQFVQNNAARNLLKSASDLVKFNEFCQAFFGTNMTPFTEDQRQAILQALTDEECVRTSVQTAQAEVDTAQATLKNAQKALTEAKERLEATNSDVQKVLLTLSSFLKLPVAVVQSVPAQPADVEHIDWNEVKEDDPTTPPEVETTSPAVKTDTSAVEPEPSAVKTDTSAVEPKPSAVEKKTLSEEKKKMNFLLNKVAKTLEPDVEYLRSMTADEFESLIYKTGSDGFQRLHTVAEQELLTLKRRLETVPFLQVMKDQVEEQKKAANQAEVQKKTVNQVGEQVVLEPIRVIDFATKSWMAKPKNLTGNVTKPHSPSSSVQRTSPTKPTQFCGKLTHGGEVLIFEHKLAQMNTMNGDVKGDKWITDFLYFITGVLGNGAFLDAVETMTLLNSKTVAVPIGWIEEDNEDGTYSYYPNSTHYGSCHLDTNTGEWRVYWNDGKGNEKIPRFILNHIKVNKF